MNRLLSFFSVIKFGIILPCRGSRIPLIAAKGEKCIEFVYHIFEGMILGSSFTMSRSTCTYRERFALLFLR